MEENQKKSFKMPIIALVIILLIIVGVVIFFTSSKKPKDVFTAFVDSSLEGLNVDETDIKTLKSDISLGVSINNGANEQIQKAAEYLNKAKFNVNLQMDYEQQKELIKLGVDYDNQKALDARLVYTNQEDNAYAYVEELFDKYFSIPVEQETKEQLSEIFNQSKDLMEDQAKAMEILSDTISDNLKEEYFTQEKVDVDVNGDSVGTKKSTLTLTPTQLGDVIRGAVPSLLQNDTFMNCFSDEGRTQVETLLNNLLSSANENLTQDGEGEKLEISIYTKGFNSTFVKLEFIVYMGDGDNLNISILNTDENSYNFKVTEISYGEFKEDLNCDITINEIDKNSKEFIITSNVEDVGDITVNLQVSATYNEDIESLDTSNNVSIDNLTTEDQQTIMTNLQNMKIYQLFQEITNSMNSYNSYDYNDYDYPADVYNY